MKYLRNIQDGTIKAVEDGSDTDHTLAAERTSPNDVGQTFPLWEQVPDPGGTDLSGIPDWVADTYSEGAVVKHGGKLYIAKGGVLTTGGAPDTNTTDWDSVSPLGGSGSGAVTRVDVPLAYNDADLIAGTKAVLTPAVGDQLLFVESGISIDAAHAFDGTTPTLTLKQGATTIVAIPLDNVDDGPDAPYPGLNRVFYGFASAVFSAALLSNTAATIKSAVAATFKPVFFAAATPVTALLDDGAGGDPGGTDGVGELRLSVILKP